MIHHVAGSTTFEPRLRATDEAALDWFYGEGQALFERSNIGAMLERQMRMSVTHLVDPEIVLARRNREPWEPDPGDLTARPTAEVRVPGGSMPPLGAISRFARVSRILRALAALDMEACAALAAFHGDQGARWGRTVYGRFFAVFPMTVAGRELIERARKPSKGVDLGLSGLEQLAVLLDLQKIRPMPAVAMLYGRARLQALKVHEHACTLWNTAKGEP